MHTDTTAEPLSRNGAAAAQRLAERFDLLDQMAVAAGWQVERVVTDQSLLSAVTRLHSLLSQGQVA